MAEATRQYYQIDSNVSESAPTPLRDGMTVRDAFSSANPGKNPADFVIRMNDEMVDINSEITDDAILAFTPGKVAGA